MENYRQNRKQIMGIIGRSIGYSLSPFLHHTAAKYLHKNITYKIFDVDKDQVHVLLNDLWESGCLGLNVTSPYKKYVGHLCHRNVPVNTLFRHIPALDAGAQDVFFSGTSTDGQGFVQALKKIDLLPETVEQVIFLGFGGAAESILRELPLANGLNKRIFILRRKPEIDRELCDSFLLDAENFYLFSPENFLEILKTGTQNSLVIQATNAPHQGETLKDFASVLKLSGFNGTVLDLCYRPPSALVWAAKDLGLRCQDGLPMLVEQARESQKLWWGQAAPYEVLMQALLDFLSGE